MKNPIQDIPKDRVLHGGGFFHFSERNLRVSRRGRQQRSFEYYGFGFRLVRNKQ